MRFGKNKVFENVSCSFTDGLSAISGANGSGKTTLMKILAGLTKQTSGNISYSTNLSQLHVGFDSPYISLYPELSVSEIIKFFAKLKDLQEFDFDEWELKRFSKKKYKNLSSGYKQRVKLMQAFMGNPDILLLDEPEQHLDEHGKSLLIKNLKKRDKMTITSTNNPEKEWNIVLRL